MSINWSLLYLVFPTIRPCVISWCEGSISLVLNLIGRPLAMDPTSPSSFKWYNILFTITAQWVANGGTAILVNVEERKVFPCQTQVRTGASSIGCKLLDGVNAGIRPWTSALIWSLSTGEEQPFVGKWIVWTWRGSPLKPRRIQVRNGRRCSPGTDCAATKGRIDCLDDPALWTQRVGYFPKSLGYNWDSVESPYKKSWDFHYPQIFLNRWLGEIWDFKNSSISRIFLGNCWSKIWNFVKSQNNAVSLYTRTPYAICHDCHNNRAPLLHFISNTSVHPSIPSNAFAYPRSMVSSSLNCITD